MITGVLVSAFCLLPKSLDISSDWVVGTHEFDPSTWEADLGQHGLQSKFQDSQGYPKTLSQKKKRKKSRWWLVDQIREPLPCGSC